MTEATAFRRLLVALLGLGGFALAYRLGGWKRKAWRRWAGGLLFASLCTQLALWSQVWQPQMLLAFLSYPLALSIGYGALAIPEKLFRRLTAGVFLGVASAPFLLPLGLWGPWAFQIILSTMAHLYFGLTNPTSATGEEGLIGLCGVAIVPFMLLR